MTQVFASMVVTTTTVTTEITVAALAASWVESLAGLKPTTIQTSNRPGDAAIDRRGISFYLSVEAAEQVLYRVGFRGHFYL
jgi:hypothetical protein